jgi:hypothetical protein
LKKAVDRADRYFERPIGAKSHGCCESHARASRQARASGPHECDFAILIEQAPVGAGLKLTSENVVIDDGLKKKSA